MAKLVAFVSGVLASTMVQVIQAASSSTPTATPWPQEFTIAFTTNNGTASGILSYDWKNKRQLIYHGPGSKFCLQYTNSSCSLLFNVEGTFVLVPSLKKCWLDIPGVGSLPPQWTTSGEFAGVETIPGVGDCRAFKFPPTQHVYMETIPGGAPCVFVFPDPEMSYYFLLKSFTVAAPSEEAFALPDYCPDGARATV